MTEHSRTAARSSIPDDDHRWRCGACGNLTRFDVVRSARTKEFWHLDLSGAESVEVEETLSNEIVSVTCRWCGRADQIDVVTRPGRESA
jgi:RNase P subunit RPR2